MEATPSATFPTLPSTFLKRDQRFLRRFLRSARPSGVRRYALLALRLALRAARRARRRQRRLVHWGSEAASEAASGSGSGSASEDESLSLRLWKNPMRNVTRHRETARIWNAMGWHNAIASH